MATLGPVVAQSAAPQEVKRLSVAANGAETSADSAGARISANGRRVAFASDASNLVAGDANRVRDVFVADVATGRVQRVSVSSSGREANAISMPSEIDVNGGPSLSADGRFVAFQSTASNLVAHDTNRAGDIFVRDLEKHTTRRVSVTGNRGTQANGGSLHPALSASGRWVAFSSGATNLVKGDTNGQVDVFVRDLRKRKTVRVSVTARGKQANGGSLRPSISRDGRLVVYESLASNIAGRDPNDQAPGLERMDVFARDLRARRTERISVSSAGASGNGSSFSGFQPSISANGRFVVFDSGSSNLASGDGNDQIDTFLRDRKKHRTRLIRVAAAGGNGNSGVPSISSDGKRIAFESNASNLGPPDANGATDVFVFDLRSGKTALVSSDDMGGAASGLSFHASISRDGRTVSFASNAGNLGAGDSNGHFDVFVRGLPAP
jgi:Tol biopolymer transport system component